MTTPRAEPGELTAGRELDALIAEKVMGAVWADVPKGGPPVHEKKWLQFPVKESRKGTWLDPVLAREYGDSLGGERQYLPALPHYSTDIAAAWEVVENMEGRRYTNEAVIERWDRMIAQAHIQYLTADHAAEAICLAALKAVEA